MILRSEEQALGAARARRRLLARLAAKVMLILAIDFVLLRLAAPNLVNMHSDLALVGALGCMLLALAATGWLGLAAWRDATLLNGRRPVARVLPRED